MERVIRNAKRYSPALLTAMFAATAGAAIPGSLPALPAKVGAPAPTLVRLETDALTGPDRLTIAMNSCVEATVVRDFERATSRCDLAVSIAADERAATGSSVAQLTNRRETSKMLAAAVSNRAVLRWMKSDPAYARDLRRAQALAPGLDFVQTNAAVIGVEPKPAVSVVAR